MALSIRIKTDNAAFEGEYCGQELARILRNIADRLENWQADGFGIMANIYDSSGNAVGILRLEESEQ